MKKQILVSILLFIIIAVYYMTVIAGFSSLLAQALNPTGEEIIKHVNDVMSPESTHSTSEMTITTTSGKKRTFGMESWSKNKGEKNLVRYTSPSRIKDQSVLMLNNADDIWMYFPRTKRVRKMATHAKKQKMQGSDFSYEDMGSGDSFLTDFDAKRLEDEEMNGYDCFKVELLKKASSDMSYSKLLLWIIKENFVPIVIDYFDENDESRLLKRLVQSDIKKINGFTTAMKSVMQNQNDKTETVMELIDVQFNIELDDAMFTERGLKK